MTYNYNEIATVYDTVRSADDAVVVKMAEICNINQHSAILEIGCGTANYLSQFKNSFDPEVWGLDASVGMLDKARAKCPDGHFICGDATSLQGIPDNHFDMVYMVDVIHHIKDIQKLFHAIARVLKTNGKLFIFSDHYDHIKNRLTTHYFPETLPAELSRYQDYPELIAALHTQGYSQVEASQVELGTDTTFGPKLLQIAKTKGYSMFGLITEEALARGIQKLETDLKNALPILYHQKAPYIVASKSR